MKQGYTQVEGKFYMPVQVVILDTNKATPLYKIANTLFYSPATTIHHQGIGKHLYFTNNEEIKKGDWITDGKYIERAITDKYMVCKKIIATTDKSLEIKQPLNLLDAIKSDFSEKSKPLPRPSNSFLEAFVRKYNKGNKIEKVLIETVNTCPCKLEYCTDGPYLPKIAPDNTITIRPLGDAVKLTDSKYIREEEMLLNMQYYLEYCQRHGYVTPMDWLTNHKHF